MLPVLVIQQKRTMQKHKPIIEKLFPKTHQLIDGTDEIFELDLASWEYETLSKKELLKRSAYFKFIEKEETIHCQTCNLQNLEAIHKNSSFRTKAFFLAGKYSTGYATHSLFPYRGKFHPQLIRALLNVLKLKPGNIVLDPMAGSGTLPVEANLLGIDAIAIDLSPFCSLMSKVKTFALNLDLKTLSSITKNPEKILSKLNTSKIPDYFISEAADNKKNYYEITLLAFLDAMGFVKRSNSPLSQLFPRVLQRYIATIKNFQTARQKLALKIGTSQIIQGSILQLPLKDNSIDAIITSPPYSFAIDYLKNDQPQLEYLGCTLASLKNDMIGLQGSSVKDKLKTYFNKMDTALKEMRRVAKNDSPIVIIIGTNSLQTNGVKLETKIIDLAEKLGLNFEFEMTKPIKGLNNTMKSESILFFTNLK